MTKLHCFYWYLIFALIVCSCSIEVHQTVAIPSAPSTARTPSASSVSRFPTTQVPITWADLKLSGKLVYLSSATENNTSIATIQILDLSSGSLATVYSAPPTAWIYYAALSPDGKQLVLSYVPASQASFPSNRSLYDMPLDGSAPPQPLFTPPTPDDHYIQAEWSADG